MKKILVTMVALTALAIFISSAQAVMNINTATIQNGWVLITGNQAPRRAAIFWQGVALGINSNPGGVFQINTSNLPPDCVGKLKIGTEQRDVVINNCTPTSVPTGGALVTGQTTPFQANKNDGITGPVDVDDDGTRQEGDPLEYTVSGDGLTITDNNTGLMWERKIDSCSSAQLHCYSNTYVWSGNGTEETVWDWLDDVNAETSVDWVGVGHAGYNDWRIPNIRELLSIVNFGRFNTAIDPKFGPTWSFRYWSSTTDASNAELGIDAWAVNFIDGSSSAFFCKCHFHHVRAVRGP